MGYGVRPIVVTGAGGYLGMQVALALHGHGAHVIALTRAAADLRDGAATAAAIPPGATVVHCAARVPRSGANYANESQAAESLRMVESILATQPHHLVFVSSMTVYRKTGHVTEEDAGPPAAGYAGMKRRAELAIESARIPATILRLPGLFGPPRRNGLLYGAAARFAAGGSPDIVSDPPLWAAMHVADAAEMCARAALRSPDGLVVMNVGYDRPLSVSRAIADLAGRFGVAPPPLPDAPEIHMDVSRMRALLGAPPRDWPARLDELVHALSAADA